jgi:hypothetical protein
MPGGWFSRAGTVGKIILAAGFCLGTVASCATHDHEASHHAKNLLIGKSEADVVACAGQPLKRTVEGGKIRMFYRNEPDVLERSFATTKGSTTCPNHGCEAVVVLEEGRAADVEYHPFPEGVWACDHCDRIFLNCRGK